MRVEAGLSLATKLRTRIKRNHDTAVVIRTGAALSVRIFVFLRLFTAKRLSGVKKNVVRVYM